jgi:DNA-binding SARP family transcriptional activator
LRIVGPAAQEQILLPGGKPLLALALLVTRYPNAVSRNELASLGWGESDEAHARASLRQAIYRIRQLLGNDAVQSDARSVQLTVAIPSDWAR